MIEQPQTRAEKIGRTADHAMPLELRGITIRYDGGGGEPLVVAEDFDLGLEAGSMHCLAGRSGSGKTSILTVAAGLTLPTSGEVFWQGDSLDEMDDDEISDRRRALIGYVDQGGALIDGMSALENVLLPAVRPQDVLLAPTQVPPVQDALAEAYDHPPRTELIDEAVRWLDGARRPAIVAGGGVRRAGAEDSLRRVAERLSAPVICSPGGNGAFPWEHPLSLQSWVEDRHTTGVLEVGRVRMDVGRHELFVDDEPLFLPTAHMREYARILDMRNGTLTRDLMWTTPAGKHVRVRSCRLVSFEHRHVAAISFEVIVHDRPAPVVISSEIVNRQDAPFGDDGRERPAVADPRRADAAVARGAAVSPRRAGRPGHRCDSPPTRARGRR